MDLGFGEQEQTQLPPLKWCAIKNKCHTVLQASLKVRSRLNKALDMSRKKTKQISMWKCHWHEFVCTLLQKNSGENASVKPFWNFSVICTQVKFDRMCAMATDRDLSADIWGIYNGLPTLYTLNDHSYDFLPVLYIIALTTFCFLYVLLCLLFLSLSLTKSCIKRKALSQRPQPGLSGAFDKLHNGSR